ncbi:uncharacterized protein CXQ87_001362 [Candidozyma duobushaemuli]|uniref:Uncharacterized protein n=2 Tax=Candidozyma TaxID=3303203 RepID=A0ABX8I1M9_9ASCO|nr:uncharacterized protein CXQ87_001362 [[Candida] duobushaemulonis]PVH18435.1 hypothetical protein CXQ87_001362 [[Candida] duobushaemulonis]QWU86972.1 hypothetical protein CA3LBN_001190 [[Candida] haemuloni]
MSDCHIESFVVLEEFNKDSFDASKVANSVHDTIEHFAASYVGHSTQTFETAHTICAITEARFRFAGPTAEAQKINASLYEETARIKPSQERPMRIEYVVRGDSRKFQSFHGYCEFNCNGRQFDYKKELFPMTKALYGEKSKPNQASITGPDGAVIKMNSDFFSPFYGSHECSRIVVPKTRISSFLDVCLESTDKANLVITNVTVELHRLTYTKHEKQNTIFFPSKPVTKHSYVTISSRDCFKKLGQSDDSEKDCVPVSPKLLRGALPILEPTLYCNDSMRSYGIKVKVTLLHLHHSSWTQTLENFVEVQVGSLCFDKPKIQNIPFLGERQKTERLRSIEVFDRFRFSPGLVTEGLVNKAKRKGLLYHQHKCETITDDASVTIFSTVSAKVPRMSGIEQKERDSRVRLENLAFAGSPKRAKL